MQEEAAARGYVFDRSKLGVIERVPGIAATEGQLAYEWQHLLRKLAARNPPLAERWRDEPPACHPLFVVGPGPIAPWSGDDRGPLLGTRWPGPIQGQPKD